jgi:hypothetical protein
MMNPRSCKISSAFDPDDFDLGWPSAVAASKTEHYIRPLLLPL